MKGNPIAIKNFEGHYPTNTDTVNDGAIPDNGFKLIRNFFATRYGTFRARWGFRNETGTDTYNTGNIVGHWKTAAGISKLIINDVTYGTSVVELDGTARATLGAFDTHLLLQWNNLAFMFNDTAAQNIRTWDGAALVVTAVNQQATVGVVHKSRMFVCNNLASGTPRSQLSYSEIFDANAPNIAAGWPGNTVDVQSTDADFITAVVVMNDVLFVFKRFSTWALYVEGTPPWTLRNLHPSIGCVGRDTVVTIGGLIYFRSANGVYRTDGTTFELISGPVKEVFDNQPSFAVATCNQRSAAWHGDYYIINDGYLAQFQVYNIENGAWCSFDTSLGSFSRFINIPDYSPPRLMTIVTSSSGRLIKFEETNGYGDGSGSTAVIGIVTTKNYDFDQPSQYKLVREVDLEMNVTDEGSVDMYATMFNEYNTNLGSQNKVLATSTVRRLFRFRGPMRCRTVQTQFLWLALDRQIEINQIVFDVAPVGRVGNAR